MIFRLLTLCPGWLTRRLPDATCVNLGRFTRRPLTRVENWSGGCMVDRPLCLARRVNLLPGQERRRWDDGLPALDPGDKLIHLRTCLEGIRGVLCRVRNHFFGELDKLLKANSAGPRNDRLRRISLPLCETLECDAHYDSGASRPARVALT